MRWFVIFLISIVAAGTLVFAARPALAQVPLGLPIEGYDPPFSERDPIRQWQTAYWSNDQGRAEQIARSMVGAGRRRESFSMVEARFALGLTLNVQGRHTEAESQFRLGLATLRQMLPQGASGAPRSARLTLVREWAWYFELHLRDSLSRQGRLREADALTTFGEREIDNDQVADEPPERVGIGSLVGIASTVATFGPDREALSDAQARARDILLNAYHSVPPNDRAAALGAADALLQFDIEAYGQGSRQNADGLTRLASAKLAAGIIGEATDDATRAIFLYERLSLPEENLAPALMARAHALQAALRPTEALIDLQRAMATDSASRSPYVRLEMAAAFYDLGDLERSAILYRRIIDEASLAEASELQIRSFLGHIAMRQNRYADAIAEYRSACGRLAELSLQRGRGSRATLLASGASIDLRGCSSQHALALWEQETIEASGGQTQVGGAIVEAFLASQYAQPDPAAAALSRSAARTVAQRRGVAHLAERYEAAIAERDGLDAAPPDDWLNAVYQPIAPDIAARVESLNSDIARLSDEIASVAPQFWDVRAPRPLPLAALDSGADGATALLGADEALVYFLVPKDGNPGLVFAISRNRVAWARLSIDGGALRRSIDTLRASIDAGAYGLLPDAYPAQRGLGALPFDRAAAHDLYRQLFGNTDIAAVLQPVSTWIIVPAGPLTSLPFSLLVTTPPVGGSEGDGDQDALRATDWLVRSKAVAILPSVESLRALRTDLQSDRGVAADPLLAFVAPENGGGTPATITERNSPRGLVRSFSSLYRGGTIDVEQLRALPPLPFSWREGEALRIALDAAPEALLSGPQASKANLLSRNDSGDLARIRVLEFATHGFAAGEYDGLSEPMLVLAAAENADDWVLRASEAATLRLNTDWVVLSGCNTASPDLGPAEGLSGFARAFFLAGANSLIVSQWRVDDFSAYDIIPRTIDAYYAQPGMTKAHALRQAMLRLLDRPEFAAAHPAFWSPFILVGDPD